MQRKFSLLSSTIRARDAPQSPQLWLSTHHASLQTGRIGVTNWLDQIYQKILRQ
jgi:hypothetical protein